MKKTFNKPVLARYDIKLNENIAVSWEQFTEGYLEYIYHFTQMVSTGTGTSVEMTDQGCYQYITNNYSWDTNNYKGKNWPGQVNLWLSQFYSEAELSYMEAIDNNTTPIGAGAYYKSCFGKITP